MFAPNIAWRDVDLKAELEARVELPVVVENDANAAAWGEFTYGAGHDVDDLLLVTVGTGIGGGIVHDGELLPRRASASAPRSATCASCPTACLCGCGNRGCFEQYASGSALVREARAARARRLAARPGAARARRRRPRADHRPADHRGGPRRRPVRRRAAGRRSAAGSARASPR